MPAAPKTRRKLAKRGAAPASHQAPPAPPAPPIDRVMGKYERLAHERQERDLIELPALGYWFDADEADRIIQFIEEFCCHIEAEWTGQPLILEPWQRFILRTVFGWMRPDGTRRFRVAYVEIPRKNGKSLIGSAVGLYLLAGDREGGAQVYSSATKRDQAKVVHSAAAKMVEHSPTLRRFIRSMRNNLHCPQLGSKFEPLGADSKTQDGLNAHGHIADELHAHRDPHLFDVVQTSMGSRRQPLTFIITTAGLFEPESIGWKTHDRALQIMDRVIEDESLFAFVAAADEGDPWNAPATWAKANPNYGISVKPSTMMELALRAEQEPSFLNTFLRYHLNIWTQQVTRWIPIEKWDACEDMIDEAALLGRRCIAAVDLSSKLDITSTGLCFPPDAPDGFYDFLWEFYCPEATILERSQKDHVPYDAWARDGWLTPTPGDVVDYSFPERALEAAARKYQLLEVPFDPWNATQFATGLAAKGMLCVEFRQGYGSMSEPTKEFERLIVGKKVRHLVLRNGTAVPNPIMRWMMSNASVRTDPAGNIKPDKSTATNRIDGVVTAIMALGRAIVSNGGSSVYNERGVLFL